MTDSGEVAQHYAHGDLFERLQAALIEDGADPAHPTVETLAPFDQFHGRGLEATREGETSFLATQSETMEGLEACGFTIVYSRDAVQETLAFSARSREMVEGGEKPPHRAVQLIHGDLAPQAMANTKSGIEQGRLVPIEVLCTKSETE